MSALVGTTKSAVYDTVGAALAAFFTTYPAGGLSVTARMATINAHLKRHFSDWHFVGFYCVADDDVLEIGPYQGDVLATARIGFGKGQCGACAAERKTQIADDVGVCANYIPCDDVTKSEIVVPVFETAMSAAGVTTPPPPRLLAVLDIDSPHLSNFDEIDRERLEALLTTYF